MKVDVIQKVMKINDEVAASLRDRLAAMGLASVNLLSGPGAGKTTLIETAIRALEGRVRLGVVEGDPDTALDAERIARAGAPVVQINTGGGCHLEANLVDRALGRLPLQEIDLLLIENVGNLVCPTDYDLGETMRVGVVSTAEGHDKPIKYPKLFRTVDMVILNKIDLLPYVDFDVDVFLKHVESLKPGMPVLQVSCTTGEGIATWTHWLAHLARAQTPPR